MDDSVTIGSWSVTGRATISGSSTGSSVNLVPFGPGGYATLSVTLNTPLGTYTSTKTVFVGISQITAINLSTDYDEGYWCAMNRGNYYDIVLGSGVSADDFTYEVQLLDPITYDVIVSYTVSGGHQTFPSYQPSGVTFLLVARIIDHPCGTGNWFGYEMEFTDCGSFRQSAFTVFPNPANTELSISLEENKSITAAELARKSYEISIFNNQGKMIKNVKSLRSSNYTFDTRDIPNGIYYLHILLGKELIKKQVLIQH